jgi:hypothetical protein
MRTLTSSSNGGECCNPSLGSRPRQGGCKVTGLYVATLALGSRPRQRELQGCGPKGSPRVNQVEARELSQREARELSQKEAWELRQEEARELSQEEARESHHIPPGVQESARECEGVNTHTPKATPTWGDGVLVDSRNFRERL